MRRALLLVVIAMAIKSPSAMGQGINLSWNDCITQPGAAADVAYACDGSRNGVPFKIVPSFFAPDNLPQFVAVETVIDLFPGTWPHDPPNQVLPDYWRLASGECRAGNLTFPGSTLGVGSGATGPCQNPWLGETLTGIFAWYSENMGDFPPTPWPGHARLKTGFARATPVALTAGVQYIGGVILLDTRKDLDTGSGICSGCCDPMYLVLTTILVHQVSGSPPQEIYYLTAPATRNHLGWGGCAVPAHGSTWGAIKATYR